jgi:hypothetical protein
MSHFDPDQTKMLFDQMAIRDRLEDIQRLQEASLRSTPANAEDIDNIFAMLDILTKQIYYLERIIVGMARGVSLQNLRTVRCPHCHKDRLYYPNLKGASLFCPYCDQEMPPAQ